MKKVDLYPNNEVVFAVPPELIDENEPICLLDYLLPESSDKNVKVDIYFTAVGMIDIPAEEEIRVMIEEIQKNPQEFRYVV